MENVCAVEAVPYVVVKAEAVAAPVIVADGDANVPTKLTSSILIPKAVDPVGDLRNLIFNGLS